MLPLSHRGVGPTKTNCRVDGGKILKNSRTMHNIIQNFILLYFLISNKDLLISKKRHPSIEGVYKGAVIA